MKKYLKSITYAVVLLPFAALADVSLTNKDSKSHEITIKCSTTTHTSIGANVTRGIGKGPCTVTLKSNNASGSGSGSDKLVIKNGSVSRQ